MIGAVFLKMAQIDSPSIGLLTLLAFKAVFTFSTRGHANMDNSVLN